MNDLSLLRRFFDPKQYPELLRPLQALEEIGDADLLKRVVAAAMAQQRLERLAKHGIKVSPEWRCPCYLRDSRGHLHRRREKERNNLGGICYDFGGGHTTGGMVDHGRSWIRDRERVALTLEPYSEVAAEDFATAAASLAADDLVMSVCSCCSTHFPGMTSLIVISRVEEGPLHYCP
ncbi:MULTISPECIES: hypothetical protein [Nocardiopsis]|uniref:Uncharacterized protein n=1 Tax=Nocardiopsis sinuspersici TaxID=501010 RepID=A0A1V3BUX6_9ACTN|nr:MULTISPECIES: hypothetical protein [Nocardiopsis]OOC52454.1 hypothetical protein NOSIN_00225 [Nocardiopsis sinuspersici]